MGVGEGASSDVALPRVAIETAAAAHYKGRPISPEEMLRDLRPELARDCEKYGDSCVKDIAKHLAEVSGAMKKFRDFVQTFRRSPRWSVPSSISRTGNGRP